VSTPLYSAMTTLTGECDVCHERPAIGVASTSFPLSVAFCAECAAQGADPECNFEFFWDEIGGDVNKMAEGYPDALVTWKDGRFISFREWAKWRGQHSVKT
jgi:hypothetical protein